MFNVNFVYKLGLRNIFLRKKSSMKKIGFISVSLLVIFFCIGLINGTGYQMEKSIRYSKGDIDITSRITDKNISEIINNRIITNSENNTVINNVTINTLLISDKSYCNTIVTGTEESYFSLFENTVGWVEEPDTRFERGYCIIDVKTAKTLKVKKGDLLTIQYNDESGFMNTLQLCIDGIYIGNQWLYDYHIYTNLLDIQDLLISDIVNEIKIYYADNKSDVELHEISNLLKSEYYTIAEITTKADLDNEWSYTMFKYYRIFLIIIVVIILSLLFVIMSFSIKHIYFMEFNNRRSEIATLLSFGMKNNEILFSVFLETFFIYICSLCVSGIFYKVLQLLLSLIKITSISKQDFVALLGGNSVVINCAVGSLLIFILVVFLVVAVFSLKGAKNYISMHIKDIISGE